MSSNVVFPSSLLILLDPFRLPMLEKSKSNLKTLEEVVEVLLVSRLVVVAAVVLLVVVVVVLIVVLGSGNSG